MKKINLIFLSVVFLISACCFLSSLTLPKSTICTAVNLTGEACEVVWCDYINCAYNTSLQACLCKEVISSSDFMNKSDYLNRSEIDVLINGNVSVLKGIIGNATNNLSSNDVNKSYVDESISQLFIEIEDRLNPVEDESSSDNTTIIIVIVIIVCAVGIVVYMQNKNKAQSMAERGVAPQIFQKIQSEKEMKNDYDEHKKMIEDITRGITKNFQESNSKVSEKKESAKKSKEVVLEDEEFDESSEDDNNDA